MWNICMWNICIYICGIQYIDIVYDIVYDMYMILYIIYVYICGISKDGTSEPICRAGIETQI